MTFGDIKNSNIVAYRTQLVEDFAIKRKRYRLRNKAKITRENYLAISLYRQRMKEKKEK